MAIAPKTGVGLPPVIFITLKRTPQRTQRGLERLKNLGIVPTVLWGSDGSDLEELASMPRDPKCRELKHHMQNGEVGCCMSWWRAAAMIVHKDWKFAIVLEDDAEPLFPRATTSAIAALRELPKTWDVALLHNQHTPEPLLAKIGHTKSFRRVINGSWTTAAVAVSNAGARKLLKAMPPFDRPVDVLIGGQMAPFHERIEEAMGHPLGLRLYQPHEGQGWFRQDHWQPSTVRGNGGAGRIPKVIHRIWVGGSPIPSEYSRYWDSWGRFHPAWKRRTWDDAALNREWPRHEGLLKATNHAEKSDLARLLILNRHGGLYVDTDFECFHAFDELIDAASCLLGDQTPDSPCNGFMASIPGHPLMDDMVTKSTKNMVEAKLGILHKAGPEMVRGCLEPWRKHWTKLIYSGNKVIAKALADTGIVISEPWVLFPYLWTEPRPKTYGDAWAAHHWARSWWGPKEWASFKHQMEVLQTGNRGTAA